MPAWRRVAIFVSADSSPQGNYDFYAVSEEFMFRSRVEVPTDPLGGFEYERRTKPLTTLPRKEGSTGAKVLRLTHVTCMEAGSENMQRYRHAVMGSSYVWPGQNRLG